MKHRLPAALAAAALAGALLLTGCHGSREQAAFAVPDTFDSSRDYEITFWAKNDTNIRQTEIYKQAIADFEALYPNITVTLRLYTDYGDIYNDVITNIATGTTPNVCITYPDHIATYLTGDNVVVPLDDLLADAKYGLGGNELAFDGPAQGEIVPQFLAEGRLNGYYYALPYMRSTEACYVNKDMVESLGFTLPEDTLTWDFIWQVSEAAAATRGADGVYAANGQEVLIPFLYKSTDNMMIQMLRQLDAGYSTAAGDIQLFNDTTKALLLDIAAHTETGAFSTFKISGYPANFLNAGQCIFAVDSTAGATWMGSDAPLVDIDPDEIVPFETAVYPVPQFDPDHPQMISQGPSVCIFNKDDPQEVLASWLFAQYLLTDEVQIAYSQTEGYVPRDDQGAGHAGLPGLPGPRRAGRRHLLRRQDPGRAAAARQPRKHLHHAGVQRLGQFAQRRRPAHRGCDQGRAPQPAGRRCVHRPAVYRHRRALPPRLGRCQRRGQGRPRPAARHRRGVAGRLGGGLGGHPCLCGRAAPARAKKVKKRLENPRPGCFFSAGCGIIRASPRGVRRGLPHKEGKKR